MLVKLEAGAEIDVPTAKEMRRVFFRALQEYERSRVILKLRSGDVQPAAGVAVLDLGSPPDGSLWEVRSVWVSGNDPSAAITNAIALVGVGALPVDGSLVTTGLDASSYIERSTVVPATFTYSSDQVTCYSHEHLFVVVQAAAATTSLQAAAQVALTRLRWAQEPDGQDY